MAIENTKKTKTTAKKAEASPVNESVKETSVIVSENEALKAQMATMQAQMDAMLKMMSGNVNMDAKPKNSNRAIRFISLTDATVVLKGSSFWSIEGGRYSSRDFPEAEARIIAMNMPEFLRSGCVYIDDAEFVRDNDLDVVYETLLSDNDLKTLLDKSAADVIEIYQNVNATQKEIIVESIIADKKAGKNIDNNILVAIGSLCGKDLINLDDDE